MRNLRSRCRGLFNLIITLNENKTILLLQIIPFLYKKLHIMNLKRASKKCYDTPKVDNE